MDYAEGLKFDADKPIRISVFVPFVALSQLSSKEFPIEPIHWDCRYTENPAAIEVARQIYSHFFGGATHLIIRHGCYSSPDKTRPAIGDPVVMPVFDAYVIMFDYRVAAGEENPEAVQLYVDEHLKVTRGESKSHRDRINGTVKTVPGTPESYTRTQPIVPSL